MDTIIQNIVNTAYKYPKRKAVADADGWYSYERLETITDQMGMTLIRRASYKGISLAQRIIDGEGGLRVGVIMPRTKDFMIATIGTLKAGCAYVPMEPSYPNDRIKTIIEDSECFQVITTGEVLANLRARGDFDYPDEMFILMEDVLFMSPANAHVSNFDFSMNENEGLILYTSGSTGTPKGVIHNMSIINHMAEIHPSMVPFTSDSVTGNMAGFTFIASLVDLFVPLIYGGTLYIFNEEERLDLRRLHDAIVENHIDCMFMPPKLVVTLLNTYKDIPLKLIVCGGEKLMNLPATQVKVAEVYGASETGMAVGRIVKKTRNEFLLGSPFGEAKVYIVDEEGQQITEPEVKGECCISSPLLASGYNKLPDQTSEKFVNNPFEPSIRMYKTGDLMCWTKDGELEFHGRKDYMVKVNGFRVELGEIENVMSKHEALMDVACVLKTVNGADNLCFYYTLAPGATVTDETLKAFAQVKLAHYMVPSIYVHLDVMPRNANNKIDRLHLPEPVATVAYEYVAPETPVEEQLQKIFAKILGISELSVTTNLRSEGLDSMLTMQAIVIISAQMGIDLDLPTIFQLQTIRALAQLIDSGKAKTKSLFKVHDKTDVYPAPRGMVNYMSAHVKGYPTLYIANVLRIENGKLSEMEPALQAVATAHPSMKVVGDKVGRKFVIYRDDEKPLPVLTKTIDFEPDASWLVENCFRPAQIVGGYLINFALVETPFNGYFICQGSHAVMDGSGLKLLNKEFCSALAGACLEPEKYTIFDYALDEQRYYRSKAKRDDENYYRQLTEGLLENILPFDPDPEVEENIEARYSFLVDQYPVDKYCQQHNIRQNSFFGSAYMQAFGKLGGWDSVMVSSLQSNRGCSELANIMNLTMRNYPLVSPKTVPLESPNFQEEMLADMENLEKQVNHALKMNFYDYYSSSGLGDKSPNNYNKSTYLYYVGLTDKLYNPLEETNMLGRQVSFVPPVLKGSKKMANDCLCVHVNQGPTGKYEVVLVYTQCYYHKETMQRLAQYMQDYIKKLVQ